MSDTGMQRLIDEAQAALDDHFRPRLVVDNKAQLNMTDLVARLRLYNGGYGFAAKQMKEAADEIERMQAALVSIGILNASASHPDPVIDRVIREFGRGG